MCQTRNQEEVKKACKCQEGSCAVDEKKASKGINIPD